MRYIDADKLLEFLEENPPYNWTDSEAERQEQLDYQAFKHLIESQPTVDVVPKAELESARADTVMKMHELIRVRCIKGGIYPAFVRKVVDQIKDELLEGGTI